MKKDGDATIMSAAPAGVRTRNAAVTRRAILVAARRQFALESYDNVGLREITRDAGVDPALISRYFGGKEDLFREVLKDDNSGTLFDGVAADDLVARLVSLILDTDSQPESADVHLDRLLIVLRSATSPKASAIVYEAIDEIILSPIASRLGTPDARIRAILALTVLMGSGIVHNVMCANSIPSMRGASLRSRLTTLFETALYAA